MDYSSLLTQALASTLAVLAGSTVFLPAAIAQEYIPPDRGLPGRREGGGTRGNCPQGDIPLTALMPSTNFGYTTESAPTLYWYVPEGGSSTAEFIVLDPQDNEVYATIIEAVEPGGIVSLSIPLQDGASRLGPGTDYHWYFSLVCDPDNRASDIFTEGWIQRIEPSASLTAALANADASDRPTIYAQSGIWYDAVSLLMQQRQAAISSTTLDDQWSTLLRSVGLENLAGEPTTSCCVTPSP